MSIRYKDGKYYIEFGNRRNGTRYVTSVSERIHGKYAKNIAEYIHDNQIRKPIKNWFNDYGNCIMLYAYLKSEDNYYEILIDKDDWERVKEYHWGVYKNPTSTSYYARSRIINGDVASIKLHRFIMNVNDKCEIVDHINGNTLDNRKSNLRVTNSVINNRNRHNSNKNKIQNTVIGVNWVERRNAWSVTWYEDKGKQRTKLFPIKKFNNDKELAYEEAVKFRKEKEELYY